MAWLKTSDKAHSHPMVMKLALLEPENPRVINEVFGYIARCADVSAEHLLDSHVPMGIAINFGMGEAPRLIDLGKRAGLWSEVLWTPDPVKQAPEPHLKLVEDEELWHIPTRQQVLFERARKRDRKGLAAAKIRLRDGDHCRYCGCWVDAGEKQTTKRTLTVDHLTPGEGFKDSGNPDDGVVACHSCNSQMRQKSRAAKVKLLLPVPASPEYSAPTREFLVDQGLIGTSMTVEGTSGVSGPGDGSAGPERSSVDPAITSEGHPDSTEVDSGGSVGPEPVSVDPATVSGPGDGSEGHGTAASGDCDPAIASEGHPDASGEPHGGPAGPEPVSVDPAAVGPPEGIGEPRAGAEQTRGRGIPRPLTRNGYGHGRGTRVGSGRDGPGQDGAGLDGPKAPPSSPTVGGRSGKRRKRKRR